MKKILTLMLALVMVFTLAACSNSGSGAEMKAATPVEGSDTVGYITDDVDHFARDPYNYVYAYYAPSPLVDATLAALQTTGKAYNFEVTPMSGDESPETYMQNLEVLIDRGDVDGFFIDTDPQFQDRLMEVLDGSGIPYMNMYTAFFDKDGACVTPTVGLDQYASGYEMQKWLNDYSKEYWGENLDPAQVGLINIDFSISPDLQNRTQGISDAFLEMFPGSKNVFVVDGLTGGTVSAEVGYDLTSQTVSANSGIKYWFVNSCLENYAQGGARVAEALNREDEFLIGDVGGIILGLEWDAGYDGSWKACFAISDYAYAAPASMGLIAMTDGRATRESLWEDERKDGDKATIWEAENKIVTKDDYKEYYASVNKKYGVE